MSNALIHDNSSIFYIMSDLTQFFEKINFEGCPHFFDDGDFIVELNFKSMVLTDFHVIILHNVLTFDPNAKSISLCEILDLFYLEGEQQFLHSDFLQPSFLICMHNLS